MACFTATVAEAVIVTAAAQIIRHKEKKEVAAPKLSNGISSVTESENKKTSFSTKLMWLAKLLWGGSFLLAFEHVWHGEVVPWFPFLTAMSNPESTSEMLYEIATAGVAMMAVTTLVWAIMLFAVHIIESREEKADKKEQGV